MSSHHGRHRPPTLAERTAARCRRAAAWLLAIRLPSLRRGEPTCPLCGCRLDALCQHECCDPATGQLPAVAVAELTGQWDDLPGGQPGCVTEYWPDGPNGRDVGELEPLPAPVAAALAGRLAAAISPGTAAGYWTPRTLLPAPEHPDWQPRPVGGTTITIADWQPADDTAADLPPIGGRPDVADLDDRHALLRLITWATTAPLSEVTHG